MLDYIFLALFIIIVVIVISIICTKYIVDGGAEQIYYSMIVPEFCNDTNDTFKNCDKRNLNMIEIAGENDASFDQLTREILYPENVSRYAKNSEVGELLADVRNDKSKIREIKGFYNVRKKYDIHNNENCGKLKDDDCGLSVGTFISEKKFPEIFKNPAQESEKLKRLRSSSGEFHWSKGTGKLNLLNVMKKMQKMQVKWIILDAAGDSGLRDLYASYGFKVLLQPYKKNLWDDEWMDSETYLMYGRVSDIISQITNVP
jgi:hypothetical protein